MTCATNCSHASGDVVGPGFFEPYLDAENTLNKPYGGAEQNMYNFAYNLYQLLYLKATDQLREETLETVLDGMNLGVSSCWPSKSQIKS